MKKYIALLLAMILCAALAACGKPENPDHAYVLSLMERGDYDMAITVLENLRDQAHGTTGAAAVETTETAPVTEATKPPMSEQSRMVLETVNRFMEEKGNGLVESYVAHAGQSARKISVSNAIEYRLGNWDSFDAHFLMICLDADIHYDGFNDQVQLLLDLDSNALYDSTMVHDNIPDPAVTKDDVCLRAVNAYFSYRMYNQDILWADAEYIEEMTQEDISAVNEALN